MQKILTKQTSKDDKYAYAIADLSKYKDSMYPLIEQDIAETQRALTQ